jgi:uncharacterized integral membrane protein (TIGR00698 family)
MPGLLVAAALAFVSTSLAAWIGNWWLAGARSPISPVTLALVMGLVLGNAWVWPARLEPGLRYASVTLLRLAIVLLGLQLSVAQVAQVGLVALPIVAAVIASALLVGVGMARALRLPNALGLLVAVGTAICGVSAIAAAGPTIRARREEVALAIAVITLLGLAATLSYPLLVPGLLGPDPLRMGIFLGVAIHDTSQVTGAALMVAQAGGGEGVVRAAVVTKLLRNATMVVVLPLLAWWSARGSAAAPLARAFPSFVLGFLALAALRTVGDLGVAAGGDAFGLLPLATWLGLQQLGASAAGSLMVMALAALGMTTRFRTLLTLGPRPFVVGFVTAAAVALLAWALVDAWVVPLSR